MGAASGGLAGVGSALVRRRSDEDLRKMADSGGIGSKQAMTEIQRRMSLGDFGKQSAGTATASVAAAPTGNPGSDSRFKSIEERLSKLEGGGESTAVGDVSNTVTEFGKGYDFGTGGSAVAGNSTGMVNPPPMMPAEESSFEQDKSSRAFNPLQTKAIVAQYGSMKERNEAAGYYEK